MTTTHAPSASPSVMARLKEATAELHTRAERSPFQSRLVRGAVPAELYARWLGQMYLVHTELESRLRGLVSTRPDLAPVVREELFQTPRLHADLEFLGVRPDTLTPDRGVQHLLGHIAHIASVCPVALLGFNYVLEGSKNGGRYIARGVRRSLNLEPGRGDQYLDPHGEQQPALWGEYRQHMDAIPFTPGEVEAMIDAACRTFVAAAEIGDDVLGAHPGA